MDGELKFLLWGTAFLGLVILFIFVCAPAWGIHIPVPSFK